MSGTTNTWGPLAAASLVTGNGLTVGTSSTVDPNGNLFTLNGAQFISCSNVSNAIVSSTGSFNNAGVQSCITFPQNPTAMCQAYYGNNGDRYGIGQWQSGYMRMFTSGYNNGASVSLSFAQASSGTFVDAVRCTQSAQFGSPLTSITGTLGVGTTPAYTLDVKGVGVFRGDATQTNKAIRISDANNVATGSLRAAIQYGNGTWEMGQDCYGNGTRDFYLFNGTGNYPLYVSSANPGYVGIQQTAPAYNLDVNGTVGVSSNNPLRLGTGVAGQDPNAGKIGYQTFTTGALDIVGAGAAGPAGSRMVKLWDNITVPSNISASGGTFTNASIGAAAASPYTLDVTGNVRFAGNVIANNFIFTSPSTGAMQPLQPAEWSSLYVAGGLLAAVYSFTTTPGPYPFPGTGAAYVGSLLSAGINYSNFSMLGLSSNFEVLFTGLLLMPYAETVTFQVTADDGAMLWVGNQQLVGAAAWIPQTATSYTGQFANPVANTFVPVRLQYYQGSGGSQITLSWAGASTTGNASTFSVIPAANMYSTGGSGGSGGTANGLNASAGSSIIFKIGGTEYARVASTGNVGIGTQTPAYLMDVAGSARSYYDVGAVTNTNGGASNPTWANLGTLSGTARYKLEVLAGAYFGGSSISTGVVSTIMCTIANGGQTPNILGDYWNVGYDSGGVLGVKFVQGANNTTYSVFASLSPYPLTDVKVHTTGGGSFVPNGANASDPGSANTTIIFGTSRMTITANNVQAFGSMSIGASAYTAPSYPLDVSGSARLSLTLLTSQNGAMYVLNQAQSGSAFTNFALYQGAGGDTVLNAALGNPLEFKIGNAEKMRLDSNGNLGINTINPGYPLDVNGVARVSNNFILTGTQNNVSSGGHLTTYTTSDSYPLMQNLNYSHDNVSLNFDVAWNGSTWISSSSAPGYSIYKTNGVLSLQYWASSGQGASAGTNGYATLSVNRGNVGINNVGQPAYPLQVGLPGNDLMAINPNAFKTLMAYEDLYQGNLNSCVLSGNATYVNSNTAPNYCYIQLTSNASSISGNASFNFNPGESWVLTAETYAGGGTGADLIQWYACNYTVTYDEYSSSQSSTPSVSLAYAGTVLTSVSASTFTIPQNQWNSIKIVFTRNRFRIFMNNTLIISYRDVQRDLTSVATCGFYGFCGGSNNFHNVRNIRLTKFAEDGKWSYSGAGTNDINFVGGNVAIGTIGAAFPLDVTGNIRVQSSTYSILHALLQTYNGVASPVYLDFSTYAGSTIPTVSLVCYDDSNYSGHLAFLTKIPGPPGTNAQTEKMRITNVGSVGIGTSTPAALLDVSTSSYMTNLRCGGYSATAITLTNSYPTLGFNIIYGASGGTYAHTGSSSYFASQIYQNPNSGVLTIQSTASAGASGAGVSFGTGFTFTPSNQLGVNQASPAYNLDVTGTARVTGTLLQGTSTDTNTVRGLSAQNSNMANGSSYYLCVGYGSSTNNQAEISFNLVTPGSSQNRVGIGLYGGNPALNLLASGNFGVGTTSPAYTLDVNGTARVAGSLTASSGGSLAGTYTITTGTQAGFKWGTTSYTASLLIDDGDMRICTDDYMHFYIGCQSAQYGTQMQLITSTGVAVGSGASNPICALDVYGLTNVRGDGSQYNRSLFLPETTFSGSGRAAISYGTGWEMGQDLLGTSASTGNRNFYLYNDLLGNCAMLVSNTNNVGFGTVSPQFKLDVGGQARSYCDVGAVAFGNNTNSSSWWNLGVLSGTGRYKLEVLCGTNYNNTGPGTVCTIACTISNGQQTPNILGDYWNQGNDAGVSGVKFVQGGSNTVYNVYALFGQYPLADVKVHSTGGSFTPSGTTASDPGSANTTIIFGTSRMYVSAASTSLSGSLTASTGVTTTGGVFYTSQVANQLLCLFSNDGAPNASSTNYYGLGINTYTLRYQVPYSSSNPMYHTWYCGTNLLATLYSSINNNYFQTFGPGGAGSVLNIDWSTYTLASSGNGSLPGFRWQLVDQGSAIDNLYLYQTVAGGASNTARFAVNGSGQTFFPTVGAGTVVMGNTATIPAGGANGTLQVFGVSGVRAPISTYHTGTNNQNHLEFFTSQQSGYVGCITTNGTGTTYVTSSDRRLKQDIQPLSNAGSVLQRLNPVSFKFKVTPEREPVAGFLADEVQEIVPAAVVGEKDGLDAKGEPKYQGIDMSRLVPWLTAAVKDLMAENADLRKRVERLESKQSV